MNFSYKNYLMLKQILFSFGLVLFLGFFSSLKVIRSEVLEDYFNTSVLNLQDSTSDVALKEVVMDLEEVSTFFENEFINFKSFNSKDKNLVMFLDFQLNDKKEKIKKNFNDKDVQKKVALLKKLLELQKRVDEKIELCFAIMKVDENYSELSLQKVQSYRLQTFNILYKKLVTLLPAFLFGKISLKDVDNKIDNKFIINLLSRFFSKQFIAEYKKLLTIDLYNFCNDICAKYINFMNLYRHNRLDLQTVSEDDLDELLTLLWAKKNSLNNDAIITGWKSKIFGNVNKQKNEVILCELLIFCLINIKSEINKVQDFAQKCLDIGVVKQAIFIRYNSLINHEWFLKLKKEEDLQVFFDEFTEIIDWYFNKDVDQAWFALKLNDLINKLESLKSKKNGIIPFVTIGADKEFCFVIKRMLFIVNEIFSEELGDDNSFGFWGSSLVKKFGINFAKNLFKNKVDLLDNLSF